MAAPRVYHVAYQQCTDLEPRPGWYIGPLTDDGFPHGPFSSRERAEEWREGRMLDLVAG